MEVKPEGFLLRVSMRNRKRIPADLSTLYGRQNFSAESAETISDTGCCAVRDTEIRHGCAEADPAIKTKAAGAAMIISMITS